MANVKISQLDLSSTPLTGAEEIPLVQQGVTRKVIVDNLTAGRAIDAASLTVDSDVTAHNLELLNNAGTESATIRAPFGLAASYTMVLPSDEGASGDSLITDGSGNLSWGTPAETGVASFNTRTGAVTLESTDVTGALGYTPLAPSDIGTTVEAYDATILKSADIGVTVEGYDATILKSADIGVTVQGYDADTAKTDTAQTWTATQSFNGAVRLNDADASNYAAIQAPNTLSANYTLTLPADDGTNGQVLSTDGTGVLSWASVGGTGTVTSVDMTVPTGLSVSGNPITGAGTLAVTYSSGYSIPTTASQTNWDTAYTDRLKWDGGATDLVAATGRSSLGGTTVGQSMFTLTNPSAITFPRFNADNSVSALNASDFRTAIGAVGTTDTQTLTNKTISGASNTLSNIGNSSLTNSSLTIGSTNIALGATSTSLSGLTSVASTAFTGDLTGNVTGNVSGNAGTVTNGVYTTQLPLLIPGLFRKSDPTIVAFTKTGAGSATTSSTLYVEINGVIKTIASGTSISMPTLTAGTDYAIWAKPDGTLEATSNHTSPPVANSRKIGGFHYAPGGNATAQSGGNTTPQINEYSFWDLKFRPNCADPRGMVLVAGGFWMDIYLTGVDAITNGSSKYNVTMADGSSPPKIPTLFGGNGSTTYGSYTWFEAMELATAFGKRCPTQQEFMSAAYGTTEASSVGTDQGSTILNAAYTSKWGVIQSTGVLWVWSRDRGGAYSTGGWNANTEGRGSEYNAPNAAFLGGGWGSTSYSGSRCSDWSYAASYSGSRIGSRFCCDHLQLD